MKTLARWYDMDVVYENEATKELRFGCYVNRYNEITPLVKLLEQTGRVTVTVEGKLSKYSLIINRCFMENYVMLPDLGNMENVFV